MITALVSRLMILAFGTLYPAYASYKAVRNKDVKEYVKWMMYWIVFALFTCAETFTDVLLSFWFPFYYEFKVALVFWLLSPATRGSSYLYRNFVHPAFQKREEEIDEMLAKAKERGYNTVLSLGSRSVSYATNVILQTAMKGGGGLMDHIKKSYSLTDLSPAVHNMDVVDNAVHRPQIRGRRSTGASTTALDISFPEVDHVTIRETVHSESFSDVRSNEDISSGYSSTDQLFTEGIMTRSASVNARSRQRVARQGMATRRSPLAEDSDDWDEEFWDVDTGTSIADPSPDSTNLDIKEKFPINLQKVDPASKVLGELNISESLEKINSLLKLSPHGSQCSLTSLDSNIKNEERKGKYNKPPAPKPKDTKSEVE